ncbi:hypothetical protein LEP1GSC062_2870 [Leptospira alexanderi serovar Manhao 3 str. L 60]|uniref:Uncharacterized protein n=1 Tax=Leptospira alexanderi serovar Manhao 3 str. L 60 TaxID=1049759 RepID=V6IEB4_9LEPT|nr:hypothetical protein LEP1GSC062_2870 [Leptospira alexanderi serovar Manhao 3 str. L 60]
MFRPVGRNIELNSEGIGAKSAVASHFIYEIRERFAQTFLRRTHVFLRFLGTDSRISSSRSFEFIQKL